jgi:alanyl-tRNA synthetase
LLVNSSNFSWLGVLNRGVDALVVVVGQGVPKDLTGKLSAGEWVKSALEVLGGKGGGKPTNAQGQGPNWQKVDEAMEVAKQMAALKL